MADTVVTYVRGDRYVTNIPSKGGVASPKAHALVGELWIGGLCYDALERMDGYVNMEGDQDYANSTMYWHSKYDSYVINPWLGKDVEKTKKKNILFHPASVPSHLEGCVGVGALETGGKLTLSKAALSVIWEHAGGAKGAKTGSVTILLRVQGKMKPLSACTAWSA